MCIHVRVLIRLKQNTAFGLYRDGTELRGLYTAKPQAARDACYKVGPDGW
jgi:hypothetical protein